MYVCVYVCMCLALTFDLNVGLVEVVEDDGSVREVGCGNGDGYVSQLDIGVLERYDTQTHKYIPGREMHKAAAAKLECKDDT